jgi:LPS sulfotransferase NodH
MQFSGSPIVQEGEAPASSAARLFSLARQLDRSADYDGAFAAWLEGNRIWRGNLDVEASRLGFLALLDDVISAFPRELFSIYRRTGGPAPIFVVGMPRSGSTLVEQILASHPRVHGLGEFPALPAIVHYHFPYERLGPARFEEIGQAYLREARKAGWPGWGRFTDKMLTNWQRVGIIHLLFPEAVVLHTVRDPVDTCFSCFATAFDRGNEMTFDLRDLGELYCWYRAGMAHWNAVLPGRVVDVVYEALVADPDAQIRQLLAQCGLPWNDRCLRFYENTRKVDTASAEQVRRPIFIGSVGRWRNYERYLGPLFEALGPYAPK